MESDWRETTRVTLPPANLHELPCPLTAVSFDINQELIWAGNNYGRVISYQGADMQKYTNFRAHDEGSVRSLLFNDRGVVSLGPRSVHMSMRRGLAKWHLTDERFSDLRCMSYTSRGTSEIVVGGIQKNMYTINVDRGTVVAEIPTEDEVTIMRRDKLICCGTTQGCVSLMDPNSFKVVKTIKAHSAAISDIDAQNNILLTCGYSPRNFRPLPPIPFPAGAAFCRMHPKMSTTGIVASQNGQFHVIDIANPNAVNLRQANISSYLVGLDLASSGDALILGDGDCSLQLWGSPDKMRFTEVPNPVEWPNPTPPNQSIDISQDVPLSKIGMPYYREQLLSAWPTHLVFDVGKPPQKIDPDILSKMKMLDFVGYSPNPKRTKRYQVDFGRAVERPNNVPLQPKFRSEKAKNGRDDIETPSPWGATEGDLRPFDVPVMYQKVEIKYSKFGIEDFDFEFFNKTKYSGLETHITNSYSNALLQLYKYTPIIRNIALHHTARACQPETCLLCELGFLFDMLDKANGQNCQATNFLKTFSSIHQAAALGLFEEGTSRGNQTIGGMIQSLNRFLLERISSEHKTMKIDSQDQLENVLVTSSMTTIRCVCGNETIRPSNNSVNELAYPKPQKGKPLSSFSSVLKHSFDREGHTRGWCDKCRRYQSLTTRRSVLQPPEIMMLNATATTADSKVYWGERNFLPSELAILVQDGQFFCYQDKDIPMLLERDVQVKIYELVGIVAEIQGEDQKASHLVSLVDVTRSNEESQPDKSWHIFNDFLVRTVPRDDAMNFAPLWKMPAILCYQAKSSKNTIDNSWKDHLDTNLLFRDITMNDQARSTGPNQVLSKDEIPAKGTVVAIDSEFVALQMEEMEIKADGTRETIRPSRLSLARVSVLRGYGDDDGVSFIDDYIVTHEPVVDYLTAFSGIEPGDLDIHTSKRTLVPLKLAYKRLWILLNLGCVFVGHGLLKDFRTINIHVPKNQVIDTVDIFFLQSRQRKLSLRFLAWYLLHEQIQTGNHDSIEDARTALLLYRKYLEFMDAGVFEQMLAKIYADGKLTNFKPPGEHEQSNTFVSAPANSTGTGTPGSSMSPTAQAQQLVQSQAHIRTSTPPVLKDGSMQGTVFGNQISSPPPLAPATRWRR